MTIFLNFGFQEAGFLNRDVKQDQAFGGKQNNQGNTLIEEM
jgi:hypothetical protein